MKVKPGIYLVAVSVVTSFVLACTTQNPNRPTMSFTAPQASQPANGVSYNFNQQPITLAITNVVRTGSETVTYSVEVARDTGFTNKVFNQDGIAENPSGTTSVTVPATLTGNSTYYWRWKAVVNGIAGEPSGAQNFFLKPNIVLNAPQLLAPASGATINTPRPTFTVVDSTFSGNPGAISYEFQVSTTSNFSSLVTSQTVPQQAGQTSWTPGVDLPVGTIFWRARARDLTNSVDSPFPSSAFERKAGLDLSQVTYLLGPSIANWPQTRTITNVTFDHDAGQLCISADGENWPSVPFPFDPDVAVEGNQWSFVQINGKWYGGANSWYRPGQECKTEGGADYFSDGFPASSPFSRSTCTQVTSGPSR